MKKQLLDEQLFNMKRVMGMLIESESNSELNIQALKKEGEIATVRFSFSKNNTRQEIDQVVKILTTLL